MKIIELLKENRFETGQGSVTGRAKFGSKSGAGHAGTSDEEVESLKSKAPIFPSIAKALAQLDFGGIFTTVTADRLYVVTKANWGHKSKGKVAKGFDAGTSFSVVKDFSNRTKKKHGGRTGHEVDSNE